MHQTVLLREAVEALVTSPAGFYVDGTFGRGGHSRYLLQQLNADGRVLGVDKDTAAQAAARELAATEPRFEFFHGSFAELPGQHCAGWVSTPWMASCSTSACPARNWMTANGASVFCRTARWICAWIPPAAKLPPSGCPMPGSTRSPWC